MRAFHFRDRHVFMSLYLQYVRPHLEFAVSAWAPWTREDTEKLEKVQQRAVRAVSGLTGHTYEERLVELRLPSLRDRRREIDMTQTYRIVNGPDSDQWFERADNRRPTRAAAGRDNIVKKKGPTTSSGTISSALV